MSYNKEYMSNWRAKNRKKISAYMKIWGKKYRDSNKELLKERSKNYYREHSDKYKQYGKKYRETHVERIKEYYMKNKERVVVRQKQCRIERYRKEPWTKFFEWGRNRCYSSGSYRKKGIKFLMSREEVKRLWFRDKAWLLKRPSLDRVDSYGNYAFSNCRFIELLENTTRALLTVAVKILENKNDKTLNRAIQILKNWGVKNNE